MERTPPISINTLGNYLTITINIPWANISDPRKPNRPLGADGMIRKPLKAAPKNTMAQFIKAILKTYRELKDIRATAQKMKTKCETVRQIVTRHESERKKRQRAEIKAQALQYIASGKTYTETAKATGMHRETVKRWEREQQQSQSNSPEA